MSRVNDTELTPRNPETVRSHVAQSPHHRPALVHGRANQMTLSEAQWLIRAARCYGISMSAVRFDPWAVYAQLLHLEMVASAKDAAERVKQAQRGALVEVPDAPIKVRRYRS